MHHLISELFRLNKTVLIFVLGFLSLSLFLLYDAAGGFLRPWALLQAYKAGIGFLLMIVVALLPLRKILTHAYTVYFISFVLLVGVLVFGHVGMGAQRWLNFGFIKLQPSEFMKVGLILALACYFHRRQGLAHSASFTLVGPLILIFMPFVCVLKQPDLGTAVPLALLGFIMMFIAGAQIRYFVISAVLLLSTMPFVWEFLHSYQKRRILIFLNPERDPFGSGYHILQSKIALGSAGLWGKGFLKGTQSHLNFLPEKQTDFILTLFAEEFGFMGVCALFIIYFFFIGYLLKLTLSCTAYFSRLLGVGVVAVFFMYLFINAGMVAGLVPVVGIPFPFLSYGGTSLWSLLIAIGLILNIDRNKKAYLERYEKGL